MRLVRRWSTSWRPEHRGQIAPALPGAQVGDVPDPAGAWRGSGEVPADQVWAGHRLLAGQGGALVAPRLTGPQPALRIKSMTSSTLQVWPSRFSGAVTRRQPEVPRLPAHPAATRSVSWWWAAVGDSTYARQA